MDEKNRLMQQLYGVGEQKPMGYLPLDTIQWCAGNVDVVEEDLIARSLQTKRYSTDECKIRSGALYVWDRVALGGLLKANRHVLEASDWLAGPDAFAHQVAVLRAEKPSPLYDLIADAFADYTNPDRIVVPKGYERRSRIFSEP